MEVRNLPMRFLTHDFIKIELFPVLKIYAQFFCCSIIFELSYRRDIKMKTIINLAML